MTNANRPARHCLAVLVVVLAMAVHSAWAQRQALPEEGIDLIFLVDVSRSMFEGPGNDPQRIRWDAVLLSMDLLTSEDRVLIVPFNDKTPAEHEDHPNVWVPGKLPRTLFVPRSDEGPGIRSQVHGFAKNQRNDNRIQGDEWNGDNGGTGLLYALEKAKTLMGRPLPKRHRFIILLTDGYEDSEKKPAGLEHLAQKETVPKIDPDRYSEAMRKDPRFQKWMDRYADPAGSNHPESGTRVYTIGLGTKVDEALLALVAQKTGGHFRHLHKNGELIDYFRTLIWQLKGCWTKERKVAANAAYPQEQDLMGRIRDFGILSYKEVPGAIRNISKLGPDEALKSAWSDNDGNRKDDVKPVRPDENSDSYTYDYYDRGGRDDGERVDTSLNRSDNVRRLLFAKRTDKPIFTISEPGGGGSYQRYELVPVKVSMDMGLGFDADQFDLTVALRTTDNEERLLKGPLPLTFYPADNEFRCDVDLSGLPKGGATDGYSLAITATGKPLAKAAPGRPLDKNESLFDYKLEMPPIDILVENKLELTTDLVGMVLLSNEGKLGLKKTIKIQPKRPLRVNKNMNPIHLGVVLKSKLVDWDKKEVDIVTYDKSIELGPIESGRPPTEGQERDFLLEGKLSLELHLEGNPRPGQYTGGELTLGAEDQAGLKKAISIPFRAEITPERLGFNRAPIEVKEYEGGDPVHSELLKVEANHHPLSTERPVTVTMIQSQGFDEDELWMVFNNQKGRSFKLSGNDEFRIFFQPGKNHNPGFYPIQLGLDWGGKGYVYDPKVGRVDLRYNTPKLVCDKPEMVRIQRGGPPLYAEIKVGLKGGVAAARRVSFQCLDSDEKSAEPVFRPGSRIELEPDGALELTASRNPVMKPLGIQLRVPRDLDCGEYILENGNLTADLTESVKVDMTVIVNDLEITDSDDVSLGKRELLYYPIKGEELEQTIRVYVKHGTLRPDQVDVLAGGPFLYKHKKSDLQPRPLKADSKKPRNHAKFGWSGVEIALSFPGPEPSFATYSGSLVVLCQELRLRKEIPCKVEWVELLRRPQEKTTGKPGVP